MDTQDVINGFREVLEQFYMEELGKLSTLDKGHLVVDYNDIISFDPALGDQLLEEPDETLRTFDIAVEQLPIDLPSGFKIRLRNISRYTKKEINKVRASDIGKFVSFEGTIRQKSDVTGLISSARFECPSCGNIIPILQLDDTAYREPAKCGCGRKGKFKELSKAVIDVFTLSLEEPTEMLSIGSKQSRIRVVCKGSLTLPEIERRVYPGMRVIISGVLIEHQVKSRGNQKTTKVEWYLDANYIEILDTNFVDIKWNDKDVKEFKELAERPDWLGRLQKSIFSDVVGCIDETEAVILQMFGGVGQKRDGLKNKGTINILLVGDPGTSKSSILKLAHKFCPKGLYAAGKGVSGAGLTATAVKDELTGGWALEAGLLPLCNHGTAFVDELDKVDDQTKEALHEPLSDECYHPSTEIIIGGRRVKIGEYVDKYIPNNRKVEQRKKKKCEMIGCDEVGKIKKVYSDYLYKKRFKGKMKKITFENGREIIVTPTHPLFVFLDKGDKPSISTIPSFLAKRGIFVPSVTSLDCFSPRNSLKVVNRTGRKIIKQPKEMTLDLSYLLGFYAAEGHNYIGKKNKAYEVGFSTTSEKERDKIVGIIQGLFDIKPTVSIRSADQERKAKKTKYTIRIVSIDFYNWFNLNFTELKKKALVKRAPPQVFSSVAYAEKFLEGAFIGDGYYGKQCNISTGSKDLANDYQDLLLLCGIHSKIDTSIGAGVGGKPTKYHRVIICGDDLQRFNEIVGGSKDSKKTDVMPSFILKWAKDLLYRSAIPYDGHLERKGNSGIGKNLIRNKLSQIEDRLNSISSSLSDCNSLPSLLEKTNYSMRRLSLLCGYSDNLVSLTMKNGTDKTKKRLFEKAYSALKEEYSKIKEEINSLYSLMGFRFIRIKNICDFEYSGYVYDVNIPEGHKFVSQGGLLLHNTVSVNKAGIQATLNAETNLLAAANPKHGSFSNYESLINQVKLSSTLINRFDFVYPILESSMSIEEHESVALNILRRGTKNDVCEQELSPTWIKKYISYAKGINPVLSEEVQIYLAKKYKVLKEASRNAKEGSTLPITGRNVAALKRLSEAVARSRLHKEVTLEDANIAYDKVVYAIKQVGVDPDSGMQVEEFSIGGGSYSTKMAKKDVAARICTILDTKRNEKNGMPYDELIAILANDGMEDERKIDEIIEKLKKNGDVFEPKNGFLRTIP